MTLRQRFKRFRLLPDRPDTGWAPHLYLVYLLNLIFQPLFDPTADRFDWLAVGVMVAIFLPMYYRSYWLPRRAVLINAWLMVLLGVVSTLINAGAVIFFVYAAAAIAGTLLPRAAWQNIAVICLIVTVEALYAVLIRHQSPYALISFAFGFALVIIVGAQCIFEAERARQNAKLRLAQEEVENLAKIAERERIARDLHDLLGHTLSIITLKSELASKLAERDAGRAAQEMREVERISRDALAEVRSAVSGYRAKGLQAELLNAKLALETAAVQFDYLTERVDLTPMQEGVLALALREAVTNVIRHAQATHCTVRLHHDGDSIVLKVQDDGNGNVLHEGSGLSGMRERIQDIGGAMTLTSDSGTRLTLVLPRKTRAAEPSPATRQVLNEAHVS